MSDYVTKTNLLSALGRFKENTDDLYETKADANDLKNAIADSEQRIENLEQAVSGSLVQTNVLTDPPSMANVRTITNANTILPWALLNRVGARSIAWNQFISNGNFADGTGWQTDNASISMADNVATVTASVQYGGIFQNSNRLIAGHEYLMLADVKPGTNTQAIAMYCYKGSGYNAVNYHGGTGWYTFSNIFTLDGTSATTTIVVQETTSEFVAFNVRNVMIFDLTAMGEYDSTLTDAQNIANFRAKFPASYYPYNAGQIIPLNPSGFKVVEKNKIDISTMVRTDKDGTPINGWLRWTTLVRYESGQIYYMKCNALDFTVFSFQIFFYDADGNFIRGNSSNMYINPNTGFSFTLPSVAGAFYFSVGFYHSSSLASYTPTNVLLCLNSVTDKTYEAYKETTIDTSFTSDYKYVNENCHDYSENVLVDGQKMREEHRIVGSYTFTGNETWSNRGTNQAGKTVYSLDVSSIIDYKDDVSTQFIYSNTTNLGQTNGVASVLSGSDAEGIRFLVGGGNQKVLYSVGLTQPSSFTVYYELATPSTPTLHNPFPNFPCEDGTTITAITPQTELVNAIDVPSTIAYMTKISS